MNISFNFRKDVFGIINIHDKKHIQTLNKYNKWCIVTEHNKYKTHKSVRNHYYSNSPKCIHIKI